MQAQTRKTAPLGFIPTWLNVNTSRIYAGKIYERKTLVFGEREQLIIIARLTTIFYAPLPNCPVKFYVDEKYVGASTTDWAGFASIILPRGISPPGYHTIKCVYEGDFWFAPSSAAQQIKTVKMETVIFKVYVESVARASPSQIEAEVVAKCLEQEIGVVPTKTETNLEREQYILTMLVPTEETRPKAAPAAVPIIWAIIAAIVAIIGLVVSVTVLIYVIIVYYMGVYQCGVCGARFTTCEALREHLISQHPDTWEKVKDKFECAPPPAPPIIPPEVSQPLMWILFIGAGAVATVIIFEAIKTLRKK